MNTRVSLQAVLFLMIAGSTAAAADPLDSLPADVNAVASIDVAGIYKSPLATQEQWTKKALQATLANEPVVPPGVDTLTVGSKMTYDDLLSSQGEYAIATVGNTLTLEKLASVAGGEMDTLNGRPALTTPRGTQIVAATDSTWMVVGTGGRQAASRWMKSQKSSGGPSPALREAVQKKKAGEQVVIAFDLEDLFSPAELTDRLSDLDSKGADVKSIAATLSTVQSVAIYIGVGKDVQGRLVIQLNESATPLASAIPALQERLLDRVGGSIPDFGSWKFQAAGNQLVGSGSLTPQSARRLISVLNPPGILNAAGQAGDDSTDSQTKMAQASKRYLSSVRASIDDIQDTLKDRHAQHALWLDKAARKIDELPLLNVDPDLLDYGTKVSGSFRYQAQSDRQANVRGGTVKMETGAYNLYGTYSYGPYGGAWWTGLGHTTTPESIDANVNESKKNVRFTEMKNIEDGYTEIRQALTKKYQIEF